MDDVVGGELPDVLVDPLLAVGQLNGAMSGQGGLHRRAGIRRGVLSSGDGSSPSTSPWSRSPTSAMVLPPTSGTVQRSSPATWLTRSRTDH